MLYSLRHCRVQGAGMVGSIWARTKAGRHARSLESHIPLYSGRTFDALDHYRGGPPAYRGSHIIVRRPAAALDQALQTRVGKGEVGQTSADPGHWLQPVGCHLTRGKSSCPAEGQGCCSWLNREGHGLDPPCGGY